MGRANIEDRLTLVMTWQLAVYTGIPFTFGINGLLLRVIPITRLYAMGMMLSGVSMTVLMLLPSLSQMGIAITGLVMGMSFGFFWANRDFLALSSTSDANRNYYYGLESFFFIIAGITVPILAGGGIDLAQSGLDGDAAVVARTWAYRILTGCVFALTLVSSWVVSRGDFVNPPPTPFFFVRFHPLWWRMQFLALLKGLAQGYFVTAPAMLVMTFFGNEGALGLLQTVSGVVAAVILYLIGRLAKPRHRILIFTVALALFAGAGLANALLFSAAGVVVFTLCLAMARPLHDIAYFPIQMRVIDTVSAIEGRNAFAYIFSQEFGMYAGRLCGCGLFLVLATQVSESVALRWSILGIGLIQLVAVVVARRILRACDRIVPVSVPTQASAP
jgi:YQGE family putative transporter